VCACVCWQDSNAMKTPLFNQAQQDRYVTSKNVPHVDTLRCTEHFLGLISLRMKWVNETLDFHQNATHPLTKRNAFFPSSGLQRYDMVFAMVDLIHRMTACQGKSKGLNRCSRTNYSQWSKTSLGVSQTFADPPRAFPAQVESWCGILSLDVWGLYI
jgi:hypothetical protein